MFSSVRLRAFLGTALAALVLFGGGALWLRGYVHDSMKDTARARALSDSQAIALEFTRPNSGVGALPSQGDAWWIAVDANGRWFMAGSKFAPVLSYRPEDTKGTDIIGPSEHTIWTPFTIGYGERDVPMIDAPGGFEWDESFVEIVFKSDISGRFLTEGGAPTEPYEAVRTVVSPEAPDESEPNILAVWVIAMADEADAVVA